MNRRELDPAADGRAAFGELQRRQELVIAKTRSEIST
jgi:hypothetical protein